MDSAAGTATITIFYIWSIGAYLCSNFHCYDRSGALVLPISVVRLLILNSDKIVLCTPAKILLVVHCLSPSTLRITGTAVTSCHLFCSPS
jgi:hypothetical protein